MSSINIVIPCFHNNVKNFANTEKCISKVREHTNRPYTLTIVENIERWCSDVPDVYVGVTKPQTFAENANIGIQLSNADYTTFINNDAFVVQGYLDALLECFQISDCGVATLESSQYNRPCTDAIVEDFFGGIWMISRECMRKVGLFDTSFRQAFDDADYWVRVYQAGYKIYQNRRVMVEHKGGSTIYELNGNAHNDIFVQNRIRFNEKHKGCTLPIFERLR